MSVAFTPSDRLLVEDPTYGGLGPRLFSGEILFRIGSNADRQQYWQVASPYAGGAGAELILSPRASLPLISEMRGREAIVFYGGRFGTTGGTIARHAAAFYISPNLTCGMQTR